MIGINRINVRKQGSFNSAFIESIEFEIDRYKSVLSNPAAISTLEDYKYHVGLIAGLEHVVELFKKHKLEVDNND